jgi:hypothetical protein
MSRVKSSIGSLAICLAALASFAAAAPEGALALDWIVDHPGDLPDDDVGDGRCEAIPGEVSCTLRAALDGANFGSDTPDNVTFDPSLSSTVFTPASPLSVHGDTTITGMGTSGPDAIVIDGGDATRIFDIEDSDDGVTISDLLIEDGFATGDSGGGAAINTGADLTLDNVVIQGSAVAGLTAPAAGAAVNSPNQFRTLTLSDSTISGNSITTADGQAADGAGLAAAGNLSLTNSTVSDNHILDGGTTGATGAQGGGIWVNQALTIQGSTISGNSVEGTDGHGGGAVEGPNAFLFPRSITNSTISGNSAPSGGGGLELSSDMPITAVTFADNTGDQLGGADLTVPTNIVATVMNSILGSDGACRATGGGVIASAAPGGNIDSGTTCGFGLVPGNQTDTDPLLGPLALNAPGATMTHAIAVGSPALDAATVDCAGLTVDQRGFPRPQGGPRCDVGAYEAQHHRITVTRTGNGLGGVTAAGIVCGSDCTQTYVDGSAIVLTAVEAAGSSFDSWSGCDSAAGNQCTVNLASDRMISARFTLDPTPPVTTPPATNVPLTKPKAKKKCPKGKKRVKGKCKRVKRGS